MSGRGSRNTISFNAAPRRRFARLDKLRRGTSCVCKLPLQVVCSGQFSSFVSPDAGRLQCHRTASAKSDSHAPRAARALRPRRIQRLDGCRQDGRSSIASPRAHQQGEFHGRPVREEGRLAVRARSSTVPSGDRQGTATSFEIYEAQKIAADKEEARSARYLQTKGGASVQQVEKAEADALALAAQISAIAKRNCNARSSIWNIRGSRPTSTAASARPN